jgi:hypothetical protein
MRAVVTVDSPTAAPENVGIMRIESSVTAISWIPSEAIEGLARIPFDLGLTHYDEPPPEQIDDLEQLRRADRFREANELRAFIEVKDGRIVDFGHLGKGHLGSTTVRLGPAAIRFAAAQLPELRPEPEVDPTFVRFVQTVGGRMGVPTPRPVPRKPFFQFWSAMAWTTLALTLSTDGSSQYEFVGASTFPRHWIYDDSGKLVAKSAVIDFKQWFNDAFGEHTPWGAYDSPALVREVESALERQLSVTIMRGGAKPEMRTLHPGEMLVQQGEPGKTVFLVLDGILSVEVDGKAVAEVAAGAIVGERAVVEGDLRTATLRAVTRARVAEATPEQFESSDLSTLAAGHRREDAPN